MRTYRMKTSRAAPGYTLPELVVVLAIMAVVSSVAIVRLDSILPKYRLRAAARNLGNSVRLWRASALTRDEACIIVIDMGSGQYWLEAGGESCLHRTLPDGTAFAALSVGGNESQGRISIPIKPSGAIPQLVVSVTDGQKSITVEAHPLLNKVEYR